MCKAKCPNASVSFPDFAVKKVVLPGDINARRQCSRCGMQKLLVTLKAGSVPPGTTIEKMRCPRCDELLRNLNGGRGNRNHRKRPSSSGSRNVAVNRNQMSSTSRTSATYSGQPQVRMNYSSSNTNTNRYASRDTDYADQQRRHKRTRAPRQSCNSDMQMWRRRNFAHFEHNPKSKPASSINAQSAMALLRGRMSCSESLLKKLKFIFSIGTIAVWIFIIFFVRHDVI